MILKFDDPLEDSSDSSNELISIDKTNISHNSSQDDSKMTIDMVLKKGLIKLEDMSSSMSGIINTQSQAKSSLRNKEDVLLVSDALYSSNISEDKKGNEINSKSINLESSISSISNDNLIKNLIDSCEISMTNESKEKMTDSISKDLSTCLENSKNFIPKENICKISENKNPEEDNNEFDKGRKPKKINSFEKSDYADYFGNTKASHSKLKDMKIPDPEFVHKEVSPPYKSQVSNINIVDSSEPFDFYNTQNNNFRQVNNNYSNNVQMIFPYPNYPNNQPQNLGWNNSQNNPNIRNNMGYVTGSMNQMGQMPQINHLGNNKGQMNWNGNNYQHQIYSDPSFNKDKAGYNFGNNYKQQWSGYNNQMPPQGHNMTPFLNQNDNTESEELQNVRDLMSKKAFTSITNEQIVSYVHIIAKDQNGCRFLQFKIDQDKEFSKLLFPTVN